MVISPSGSRLPRLTGACIVAEGPDRQVNSREHFDSAQDKLRDREILDSRLNNVPAALKIIRPPSTGSGRTAQAPARGELVEP